MDIRPIKTEADHAAALTRIEALMDAEANTPDGDELDVLTTLVEAYEEKHVPISPSDPLSAIRHTMAAKGFTQADLADLLKSRPRASEILNGSRELSKSAMWLLHSEWQVPAESLIAPPRKEKGRTATG
ncbi:XRE family transcriptional regulator [Thalassobaculum sp. OXR-137]|uniref:helix-turn-helix domain-containing protein n=1 Tax=Thalassobaculum sp. OXR-137 TaxID=3100173 RepID=UPI002AC8F94A|nr:XRE family transcriptional regulator [Thalassobaculum sp. OXR-137]WPZ34458.1 XRE family transcriptional regulator [Thalassobaculum sp. OXR-137]